MIKTVFAVLSLAASASALTCYYGFASDAGTTPSTTVPGCYQCTKTIQRYRSSGGSESVYVTYGGLGCTYTSLTSLTTGAISGIATVSATCAADYAFSTGSTSLTGLNNLLNNIGNTINNAASLACVASNTASSCSSNSDSGSQGYCACCSDNCNSAGLRCGASAIASFSMLSMILFAIVGYFMRQ